jgi:hypothetical protein
MCEPEIGFQGMESSPPTPALAMPPSAPASVDMKAAGAAFSTPSH